MKKLLLLTLMTMLPAFGQEPKFDLADVHESPTAHGFAQNFGGVLREGKYINRDATMVQLIEAAYSVSEDSTSGGPGWVASDLFDVIAKVPNGTTLKTANVMLQALLADRFKLVIHSGRSPVPRYVLTVGKNGSKLKASDGSGDPGCQPIEQPGAAGGRAGPGDLGAMPNIRVTCRNLTASAIAQNLHQMAGGYFDHDVIDSTKLEGSWDFDLEWTARGALAAKGADGISVFNAVEKQLGLKVELQNVPMPSLVIESVNRKPTPNSPEVAKSLAMAAARFEAASIKPHDPSKPPMGPVYLLYRGGSQMEAGGTLRALIAVSYQFSQNIAEDIVIGLPKSADTQRWDILAKVPTTGEGAPNRAGGQPQPPPLSIGLEMLRGLLVDQFELKTHTENREVTVYALTVGSGKPKLTKAQDSERVGCKPDPDAPKPVNKMGPMIACKNTTMAELAQFVQQNAQAYIDHPVVDATGLEGGWNFNIGWTPKAQLQAQPTPNAEQPPGALAQASDPDGISLFAAVEKELGLKLVKQKRSIPVIVVDHVDEKPII